MRIEKFKISNWQKIKKQFITLEEKCFVPELQMTEKEIKDSMCDKDAIVFLALEDGKLIGVTYGNLLQSTNLEWFDGHWDPNTYSHYNEKTIYITSTAVLPEYRGKGIAIKLKIEMHKQLKKEKFKYVIGHAYEGAMINICKMFGGKIIKKFINWYDSGETHLLYEIDLSTMPQIVYVPKIKQTKNYNCGVTSLASIMNLPAKNIDEIDCFTSKALGISHESLAYLYLDYTGKKLSTRYNATIKTICLLIDSGIPSIVNYQSKGEGHYSVVCGYDKENIFIMDVWDGKRKKIKKERFLKIWYSKYYGYRWLGF